jgi:hypothetical protein
MQFPIIIQLIIYSLNLLKNPFHYLLQEVGVGSRLKPLWFAKNLLHLNGNFNKNYQLPIERAYRRTKHKNHSFREQHSRIGSPPLDLKMKNLNFDPHKPQDF